MGVGGTSPLYTAFPAKAGIQIIDSSLRVRVWVPACAGKTGLVMGFRVIAKRSGGRGSHR